MGFSLLLAQIDFSFEVNFSKASFDDNNSKRPIYQTLKVLNIN